MTQPTIPLSKAMTRAAQAQREREGREAVASWLRRLAERISPDRTFTSVRARVRFDRGVVAVTYTKPHHLEQDTWDQPTDEGIRVHVRRADMDQHIATLMERNR